MKVLLINVYNYRKGGSEAVYFNTYRLLEQAGHQVARFTLKWPENESAPTSAYFPESKATRRGPLRMPLNLVNYFYHFEAERKLLKLIDDFKPDVAHIHLIWGQLTPSVLVALRRRGVPAVITAHDYRMVCPAYNFRDGNGQVCERCHGQAFYNCLLHRCSKGSVAESAVVAAEQYFRNAFFNPARMIDGAVFVSDFSRRKHLQYMPRLANLPLLTLYNTASVPYDAPKLVDECDAREPYYLFYGRLSNEKGLPTLVEAFAQLPDLRLLVVGSGPLDDELRHSIAERGLSNIEMLGYRTGRQLNSLVRGARFVIVPSECYENNPMTIVESYLSGVPVIGSRIGGIPEIIDDGSTGYQFQAGSVDDLAAVLRKAQGLTPLQLTEMSAAAMQFARGHFAPEVQLAKLETFYREVIDAHKS